MIWDGLGGLLIPQFPFWDFFCCNIDLPSPSHFGLKANPTLNSLCGISLNATYTSHAKRRLTMERVSQFPLWDFFECNRIVSFTASKYSAYALSIPFVGFLWMQHKVDVRETIQNNSRTLNSLCGISLNATVPFSAFFPGIGRVIQRLFPLVPLLQQPL